MTLVDERMERASSDLHDAVQALPIPQSRQRRSQRGQGRRLSSLRAMTAAFAAVLLIGLPALILNPGNNNSQPAAPADRDLAAADQPEAGPPSPADGIPRLIVDVSQFEDFDLVHVLEESTTTDGASNHLFAYENPGEGLASPRIWIITDPDGSDFFRGEAYLEDGWRQVPVGEGSAYAPVVDLAPAVVWDTGSGADGPAVFAYALNLDQSVLIDVVNGLTQTEAGWEATYLPEGLSETYSGPERVESNRLVLGWNSNDEDTAGEITLEFIEGGPNTLERTLYTMLGPEISPADSITTADIRGKSALRIDSRLDQTEGAETVIQWMETPTVMVRLIIQGSAIDPEQVVKALTIVDQATWEAALESAETNLNPETTPTTVAPTTTVLES